MSNPFLYVTAVLIWGSTWYAIEFQLGVVAPEVSLVYRYFAASLLLFLWCKYKGLNLAFNLKSHMWFVLLGLFLFGLNYILAYRAQIHITSALAAITFSSILWMNILNTRLFFGTRGSLRLYIGALLGVLGVLVLFGPQVSELSLSDSTVVGCLMSSTGALMASFGNIVSQKAQGERLPVVPSNAWSMFYGAVLTGVIAVALGHEFNFDSSPAYLVSLFYLTVFGSVLAFGAYLTLLGRIGAERAGYTTVMFPCVALILSIAFEGFKPDAFIVAGFGLVLLGNYLVLTRGAASGSEC